MKLGKLNIKESASRQKKIFQFALYGLLLFIAFTMADLTILYIRDRMLPAEAPPKKTAKLSQHKSVDRNQYNSIVTRNLFSATGLMPEAITLKPEFKQSVDIPILSTLPLNLIGTLVHSDPTKSIAAIEVKSKNLSASYSPGAEIEGLAKLEKVERGLAYIRNNNTMALEYIELKSTSKVSFDASKNAIVSPQAPTKDVKAIAPNRFQIKRSDLAKYLNDLSSVLMQARAVPNRDLTTGEINGFRLLDMKEDSIFGQLGLARMDILKTVNGETIDSIQKAMELYNLMKNGSKIELGYERGGKNETNTYDITN